MQPTIFTVGHGSLTLMQFVALLQKHEIVHIIDIRSIPYSRRAPWSSKSRLPKMLDPFHIRYTYLGHILGGRVSYNGNQVERQPEPKPSLYDKTIQNLIRLCPNENLSLLCSEADPRKCHRQSMIAQTLLQSDVKVLHILPTGALQEAWLEEPKVRQVPLF